MLPNVTWNNKKAITFGEIEKAAITLRAWDKQNFVEFFIQFLSLYVLTQLLDNNPIFIREKKNMPFATCHCWLQRP